MSLLPGFLAGEGWRELLVRRLAALQQDRERNLNNPMSSQVDSFFLEALGTREISREWHWPGMEAVEAVRQLDEFINLRHQIAHRARLSKETPKKTPKSYINLVNWSVPMAIDSGRRGGSGERPLLFGHQPGLRVRPAPR
jgi:hypothetical protein